MRSAATFDDDVSFGPSTPKKPARKPAAKSARKPGGRKKKKGRFAFLASFDGRKVSKYAALAMSATMVVGIMVNALIMQKGHHPAPLFGKAIELGNAAPQRAREATSTAMPVAAPKPAPAAHADADTDAPAPAERSQTAASSVSDPIGRLLATGVAPAADKTDRRGHATAVGVQKALAKLGYDVKADGTMGASTKKAIEAFEKAHRLPVSADLSRRVVKALSAESGVRID